MENLYKPREVAEMLRVSYETVLDWIGNNSLPATQLPSGQYRIYEYDINAAMLPVASTTRARKRSTRGERRHYQGLRLRKATPTPGNKSCRYFQQGSRIYKFKASR